ncbi:MAG: hypothetical protein C0485_11190 [Pirellula sp.]|nr:hypothetical protein [Pirellula sp.]
MIVYGRIFLLFGNSTFNAAADVSGLASTAQPKGALHKVLSVLSHVCQILLADMAHLALLADKQKSGVFRAAARGSAGG